MKKIKAKTKINNDISAIAVPVLSEDISAVKINVQEREVWDFSKITINQLAKELDATINKRTPFFLWSKKRLNEKIQLDNEKQLLILNKIKYLSTIGEEFAGLQAESIFSSEYIQHILQKRIDLAEQYFEKAAAEHRKQLAIIDTDTALYQSRLTADILNQEDMRSKIRKANAEAAGDEARALIAEKKLEIINKVLSEADFKNLSANQTFLLMNFLDADVSKYSDFELRERMKDILIQQSKAESDKKTAEADHVRNETNYKKWKNDQAQKDGADKNE